MSQSMERNGCEEEFDKLVHDFVEKIHNAFPSLVGPQIVDKVLTSCLEPNGIQSVGVPRPLRKPVRVYMDGINSSEQLFHPF